MATPQLDLPFAPSRRGNTGRAAPVPERAEQDCPFEIETESKRGPEPARAVPSRSVLLEKARRLASELSEELGRPVRLFVTDNRSTMLSYRRASEGLSLRVHHMFLDAPASVVHAIADYAGRGKKSAGLAIDGFVSSQSEKIRHGQSSRDPAPLSPQGRIWNLQEIFDRLNALCFEGRIEAQIGWGRGTVGRRRRTIRLGVYDHISRTIRIHPALDTREVPAFFVDYIVFHEMLHQAVPARQSGSRRQHHGPEFRARERAYPDYERALAWERENIGMLLGKPRIRSAA